MTLRLRSPVAALPFLLRCLLGLGVSLLPLLPAFDGSPLAGGSVAHADDDDDDDDDRERPTRRTPPREVIATGLAPAQLATLRQRGYAVVAQRPNALLGNVTLLRAPASRRRDPLAEVRALGGAVRADHNHSYRLNQQSVCNGLPCTPGWPLAQIQWPTAGTRCNAAQPTIGLIDTGVEPSHPALKGAAIERMTLPGHDQRRRADTAHGTAVAALLVGRGEGVVSLLPRARLLAVNAFYRAGAAGDRMEAWDLVAALDAVTSAGAQVVNMSFAGSANALLGDALVQLDRRGIVMVAAVGNAGPRAAPQYPAAYPQVIAVTAVADDRRVYHRAGRGTHVELAAPGVAVPTLDAGTATVARSGTSFAVPFVTAAAAALIGRPGSNAGTVRRALGDAAVDLGAPGRDPVYGLGLLQLARLCGERAQR
jgi:subtilisin family serine protease